MSLTDKRPAPAARRGDLAEYRLMFAASFVALLPIVALRRLVRSLAPARRRTRSTAPDAPRSVFAETMAAARTTVPFAFMG